MMQTAHEKHSKIEQNTTIIGPQVWMFDGYGQFLIENQNYYKKIIAPSEWVKINLLRSLIYQRIS